MNCCRLYTESDVNFEAFNEEAIGLVNDAKCMIDSLISWQKGLTPHGKLHITQGIREAADNLNLVLTGLESLLHHQKAGEFAISS